jgi:hypothetical protein
MRAVKGNSKIHFGKTHSTGSNFQSISLEKSLEIV